MSDTTSAQVLSVVPKSQTPKGQAVITISVEPATLEIQAHNLPKLAARFLDTRRSNGMTGPTVNNYDSNLDFFFRWWEQTARHHAYRLTPTTLTDYKEYLRTYIHSRGTTFARGTVQTNVKRVRQYLRWLHTEGYVSIDASTWLPYGAAPKGRTRTVSSADFLRVLAACYGGYRIRNVTMLCLLLESGMRRIEAANLKWENVYFNKWSGFANLEVTKRFMDDDKRRTICFGDTSGKLLQMWAVMQGTARKGLVFGITNNTIGLICQRIRRRAGVEFSPHDLRRTFATHWIRNCRTPNQSLAERLLELQLGHSPKTVTQKHYLTLTYHDVMAYYVSPLDGVEIAGLTPATQRHDGD